MISELHCLSKYKLSEEKHVMYPSFETYLLTNLHPYTQVHSPHQDYALCFFLLMNFYFPTGKKLSPQNNFLTNQYVPPNFKQNCPPKQRSLEFLMPAVSQRILIISKYLFVMTVTCCLCYYLLHRSVTWNLGEQK